MITLHGFPRTRSWRVSWTLEELRLEWNYKLVNLGTAEHRSDRYSQLNPRKKVPTTEIDGTIVTESAAACLFLAEKYGERSLLPPAASVESAQHLQWIQLITCEIEQPLWTMGKHKFVLPEERRVPAMVDIAKWEFNKVMAEVEQEIPTSGYLVGDQFTVADILLGHTLNWAKRFELSLSERAESYRSRICSRPAAQSALAKEIAAL